MNVLYIMLLVYIGYAMFSQEKQSMKISSHVVFCIDILIWKTWSHDVLVSVILSSM